jgi:mono/diheme cytochrome c family protein
VRARGAWIAALLVLLAGCAMSGVGDFLRGYGKARSTALAAYDTAAMTPEARGGVLFALGDFGALDTDALETHATPWRLAGTALARAEAKRTGAPVSPETLRTAMTRFGFLYPETIGNWPQGVAPPKSDAPLGLNTGVIRRTVPAVHLTVANLGCASCHAGATFDAGGAPRTDTAWLGAPNTSLDLEAYVQAIYTAFAAEPDMDALIAAVPQVFPDTDPAELKTLRSFVAPRVAARMKKIAAGGGGPLPFVNGAPGLTNGVAALKMQLAQLHGDAHATERGFTSIPDLGERGLRSSLLYDGAYAPAGMDVDKVMRSGDITPAHLDDLATITAFFTVPSMGVRPDRARDHLGDAKDVFRFFATYEAPRFPGPVDRAKAVRGRAVYAERCASCHGAYDDNVERPALQSFPNRIAPYDTDPARGAAFTAPLVAAVENSTYGDLLEARATGGYVAPLLTGLWMTAPYLHNGSVPTIRQLLTPAERPARFMVGGHRLNYRTLGIDGAVDASGVYAYPAGYAPWSKPVLIDTTQPGLSNRGHEADVAGMSEAERAALIEYLKLL